MNKKLKELAHQAGFCFFTKEEDKNERIDWSCDYSDELLKFHVIATTEERINTVRTVLMMLESMHYAAKDNHNYYKHLSKRIQVDFDVKL